MSGPMSTVDVIKCCHDSIRQISENIKDAIVYLDAGSTESFQFLGMFPLLLELGARGVCSLENMSVFDKVLDRNISSDPARKIMIITSRLLSDAHRYILRCLSTHQEVRQCAVYTSISEVAHSAYPDSPLGPDAFREYESLLNQDYEEFIKKHERAHVVPGKSVLKEDTASEEEGWSELTEIDDDISGDHGISNAKLTEEYGSSRYTEDVGEKLMVSVHHFPLVLSPLSPRVFVLPSEGTTAEASLSAEHESSISSGLPPLSTGKLADAEDTSPGANLTAQFLYHLALKMDLKLEIFSLGDLSKNVGKLLTDMSSLYDVGRRKRSAGLLLIDRTLDLLTPCCHGDSLVDRMFSSLSRMQSVASLSQMRGSQSQLKTGPVKVERAPLCVQIPLENIIVEEDTKTNFQILENIEAFLDGWNTYKSDAPSADFTKFRKKMSDESCSQLNESKLLNGTFVSTDNFRGAPYLEAILDRRTKDGTMLIKKWLQECLRQENIKPNLKIRPGLASMLELQSMIRALAKRQSSLVKNKGVIQLAAATAHALDESHSASWDAFSSAEKILHVNAADTSQSLAAQISDLINKTIIEASQAKKQSQGLFTLQDALLLTVIGYILAGENFPTSGSSGPFSWQEEHFMKEAIVDAILENPTVLKLSFLQGLSEELEAKIKKTKSDEKKEDPTGHSDVLDLDDDPWESWGDEDSDREMSKEEAYGDLQLKLELRDKVDILFKFLHKLSSMKGNAALREGMLALESRRSDDLSSIRGLLHKILTNILDHNDIPGLEYHSSTVGRLFKSGFGRFGIGQAKPSLSEHNIILIFVIGGINGVEVREVQEAISRSSRPDVEVILGGTTFLTPDDMCELLFGDYSHI